MLRSSQRLGHIRSRVFLVTLLGGFCSCSEPHAAPVAARIGDPLPGLTQEQLLRFDAGAIQFGRIYTTQEGLGPRFNENACDACHTDPVDGGTGEQLVSKASRVDGAESCDLLESDGGPNLRRRLSPVALAAGATAVQSPERTTHSGRFTTPFLFGMGMIDAIPQEALDALADPDDLNGDGISGRVGRDRQGRPARFGRKANVATLGDFTDEAFRLEMGLTTPDQADERSAGDVPATPEGSDPAPDPEVDAATLAATIDFVRFLAPPERGLPRRPEDAARGEELFGSLGCVACHLPALETGDHPVEALAHKTVGLFSDLLLHDMGPELAGPCASGASPQEYRTEPLMGLRHRTIFLHDGRVSRVRDAILLHGGEAAAARERFAALDRVTQEYLLEYLGTL